MSTSHSGKRNIRLSKNKKLKDKIRGVVVRNKETAPSENIPAFSETFLVGNLADLLFDIESLARASVNTKNTRIKKARIAKLKALLGRYQHFLGNHFRRIIAVFIKDTFRRLNVPQQSFKKIEAWWLRV